MNKKGFTLIELIIYVSIFVIATTIFSLFVLNLIKLQAKITIEKNVLSDSQRVMEMMLSEIRHAQEVYQPTSVFDSHPGQLSLKTAHNTPDGEQTTYLDFYLDDDNQLCLKREGMLQGESLISSKTEVKNLVFDYMTVNNKEMVRIELTAVSGSSIRGPFYQATTTLSSFAVLRNN